MRSGVTTFDSPRHRGLQPGRHRRKPVAPRSSTDTGQIDRPLLAGMEEDRGMDRRQFLAMTAAGAVFATARGGRATAQPVATSARIVIIGAGAAGTALANRLVRRLEGADITLIDPRRAHLYQPGLSLVAAGLKPAGYVVSETTDWLPSGVNLVAEAVAAVDPEAKTVSTSGGQTLGYDWLIVAPGLVLDNDAIEGFSPDMVGEK